MTVESSHTSHFISRRLSLWWRRLGRTGGNCTRLWDTQWPVSADPVCMRERLPHNVWVERGRERSGAVDGPFSLVSCRSNESVGGVLPPSPRVHVNCLHLALQVTVDCRHLPRKREWGVWTAFASLTTGQCGSPYHRSVWVALPQVSFVALPPATLGNRLQFLHHNWSSSAHTQNVSQFVFHTRVSSSDVIVRYRIVSICHTSVIVRYRLHLPHKCHREVSSPSATPQECAGRGVEWRLWLRDQRPHVELVHRKLALFLVSRSRVWGRQCHLWTVQPLCPVPPLWPRRGLRLFTVPPSGVPVESPSVRGMIKSPSAENVLASSFCCPSAVSSLPVRKKKREGDRKKSLAAGRVDKKMSTIFIWFSCLVRCWNDWVPWRSCHAAAAP